MKISNAARLIFWLAAILAIGILVRAESSEKRANTANTKSAFLRIVDQNGRPTVSGVPSPNGQTVDVSVGPGFAFNPDTVNISVGDTVRWTWADSGHSVSSGPRCMPDSQFCSPNDTNCFPGVLSNAGTVYQHTFTTPGSYSYICIAHCGLGMTGVVNVAGGCTPSGWSAGPNMPTTAVRSVGVYFQANGKFYVMGGRTMDGSGNDIMHPYEYDPTSNNWTIKSATFPDNQVNNMACGVLADSGTPYVYCVGGSASGQTTATARVFRYNAITDTISAVAAPWPGAGTNTLPGAFTVLHNKLYILGGFQINTTATDEIWEFTPGTNAWVLKNSRLGEALAYATATTIGDFIYTAGGAFWDGTTFQDQTDADFYDPVADSIQGFDNIPRATSNTRALNFNGNMWVMGGGFNLTSNEVNIYDTSIPDWIIGPAFMTARRNFPTDTDGTTRIWLAGGYASDGITPLNSMEIFCAGGPTPSPTPTPTCQVTYTTAITTGTITAGGTDIGNHCDDCTTLVNLPFSVSVYGGTPISVAYAGSNGTLQFVAVPQPKPLYFMQCVPVDPTQGGPFLNTLFPYYDDLRTDELGTCPDCGIFTQTVGTAPNRQFVIRWKTTFFNIQGATAEFEVLLTEGSSALSVIYGSADNGASAASGIQQNLNVFTSYSCFQAVLTPGLRVNYIPTGCVSPTPTPTATATGTATATPTVSPTSTPCEGRCTPTPRPRPTPAPRP